MGCCSSSSCCVLFVVVVVAVVAVVVVVEELVVVTLDYHLVVGVASVVLTLGGWYPHFDVWRQVSLTWRRSTASILPRNTQIAVPLRRVVTWDLSEEGLCKNHSKMQLSVLRLGNSVSLSGLTQESTLFYEQLNYLHNFDNL